MNTLPTNRDEALSVVDDAVQRLTFLAVLDEADNHPDRPGPDLELAQRLYVARGLLAETEGDLAADDLEQHSGQLHRIEERLDTVADFASYVDNSVSKVVRRLNNLTTIVARIEDRLEQLEAIVADHVGGIDTAEQLEEHHDTLSPPLPEERIDLPAAGTTVRLRCGARTATGATCDLPAAHGGQHRRTAEAAR